MRILFLFALLQGSLGVFGQAYSFSIEGNMTGWRQNEQLALFYRAGDTDISDTVEVVDGRFKFTAENDRATEAKLVCISSHRKGMRDVRTFYLDKGKITVNGTDSLKYVSITGKGATADYEVLHATVAPLMDRFIKVRVKGMKMSTSQQDSPEYKNLVKENTELISAIYEAKKVFILKYPASIVSLNTVQSMTVGVFDHTKVEPLHAALSPLAKKSAAGILLGKTIETARVTSIGSVMPNFTSLDTLRNPLTLDEVIKKGKVTLVDFWASWCKPCREENPNVVKAFNAFHQKGFNILSVSLDQNAASWKKAIEMDGMPWYHVSSLKYWDEPIAKQFGITGVPDSFLLDAEGKVIARGLRGEALYKKIQEIIY